MKGAGGALSNITVINGNSILLQAVVGVTDIKYTSRILKDEKGNIGASGYFTFEIMLLGGHSIPFSDIDRSVLEEFSNMIKTDLIMYYSGMQ